MADASTSIYVIGSHKGPVKVGLAANPRRRLRAIQTGSSSQIALLYACGVPRELARNVERRAHWLLREHAARGEWFSVGLPAAKEAVDAAVLSGGEGEKAASTVGRPPIKRDMKVEKTTLWLHRPVVDRIIELVGKQGLSEFVRVAIDAELKRREPMARSRKPSPPSSDR